MSTTVDPLLGRLLSQEYELVELLGKGGMSRVYRAHHLPRGEDVAVKILTRIGPSNSELAVRFRREALAVKSLDHPNIIRPIDFGQEPNGLLFLVMEYVAGENLQRLLHREGPIDVRRMGHIMTQVASALHAAHRAGIVHRDMKPANVLLPRPTVAKVCDFGLAKIVDGDSMTAITKQGICVGTPAYMSPEQAKGLEVDARADVYSCGVLMYRMLSGGHPFSAKQPTRLLMMHITDPVPPLSDRVPNLHPRLGQLVHSCLEKDPKNRCPSAEHLRQELLDILRLEEDDEFEAQTLLDPYLSGSEEARAVQPEVIILDGDSTEQTHPTMKQAVEPDPRTEPELPDTSRIMQMARSAASAEPITDLSVEPFAAEEPESIADDPSLTVGRQSRRNQLLLLVLLLLLAVAVALLDRLN